MTDFHYFAKPTQTTPGTLNPVFELLDHPVAMGRADDIVLVGPAPENPLVGGREVTDPRLLAALRKPVELERAEVLDRSAKLGGILRAMGLEGRDAVLEIAEDVPEIPRALSILAAVRIGMPVDVRPEVAASEVADPSATEEMGPTADTGSGERTIVRIHSIPAAPTQSGRASVKVVRSRFEGVGVSVSGETANLDQAMRDSRVESAEVVPLSPETTVIVDESGEISAGAGVAWLREHILDEDRVLDQS